MGVSHHSSKRDAGPAPAALPTPERRDAATGRRLRGFLRSLLAAAAAALLLAGALPHAAQARSCPRGGYHETTLPGKWEFFGLDIATYSITGRWCTAHGRIIWKRAAITSQYGNHGDIRLVSRGSSISRT